MQPLPPIPSDLRPEAEAILAFLSPLGKEENRQGMARYGITVDRALGVGMPLLRLLAKRFAPSHELALALWTSEVHEARILAGLVDDPTLVQRPQMEVWAQEFDSWDICDGTCCNLFRRTAFAESCAMDWSRREEEYVKRAGFVLMATLGVHRRGKETDLFLRFLDRVQEESPDDRPMVKKAVNWALRQIGKRCMELHPKALALAEDLRLSPHRSARWIGGDAARELRMETTITRILSSQTRRTR